MTTASYPSPLYTAIATAQRVTVIPVTDDGLIAIACGDGWVRCGFPTAVKAHPRVRTEAAARRLLERDLGCQTTDLRLVAIFDPPLGRHRHAVYTAAVHWPAARPTRAGCGRHRLLTLATRDQATRAGLQPAHLLALLPGSDLTAATRALPPLHTCTDPAQLHEPSTTDAEPRRPR